VGQMGLISTFFSVNEVDCAVYGRLLHGQDKRNGRATPRCCKEEPPVASRHRSRTEYVALTSA